MLPTNLPTNSIQLENQDDALVTYHNGSIFIHGIADNILEYDAITLERKTEYKPESELSDDRYFNDIFVDGTQLWGTNGGQVMRWTLNIPVPHETYDVPHFGSNDNYVYKILAYNNHLFACGENNAVVEWDIQTQRIFFVYKFEKPVHNMIIKEDKLYIISDNKLFISNLNDHQPIDSFIVGDYLHFTKCHDDVSFLPGNILYITSVYGNSIILHFDINTNTFVSSLDGESILKRQIILKNGNVVVLKGNQVLLCEIEQLTPQSYKGHFSELYKSQTTIWDISVVNESLFIIETDKLIRMQIKLSIEEDDWTHSDTKSDASSIISERSIDSCTNSNLITLEPYSDEDNPVIIYTPSSANKFEKSICATKEELIGYLRAFQDTSIPDNIMTIYSRGDASGFGGEPLGKIVVKLPVNNMYVTMGSMRRVIQSDVDTWYALPLFSGKRRRIGNLKGIYGASMNHGQIPGFQIFKLYTRHEIEQGVLVQEDNDDYPYYYVESARTLFELLGGADNVNILFVKGLINDIIGQESTG